MESKMKADDCMEDTNVTEFQYLKTKVQVLQDQVQLISDILHQHGLALETKEEPERDIEDAIWKRLEE